MQSHSYYYRRRKRKEFKRWNFYKISAIANIIVAVAAVVGILYAVYNVNRQLTLDSEIKAIELFNEYSQRAEKNLDYCDPEITTIDSVIKEEGYGLFAHYVLFISESIYNLEKGNGSWEYTLENYTLYPHYKYYESQSDVIDSSLSEGFRNFYYKIKDKNRYWALKK